ncbi:MAG: nitroreductase family protein [Candidatus Aminicenantes bacterium]
MSFYDLIISRRTVRQFKQKPIHRSILKKMINAARLAPSAANTQPLEFVAVHKKNICQQIFPCLKWAAYIAPRGNPKAGKEPVAYIVTLVNKRIKSTDYEWDAGAAIENMILTAWEEKIASCWLLSVEREKVKKLLKIPDHYLIDSVLALGYPDEKPVAEDMKESIEYWKDQNGRLHVPKRKLKEVLHFNGF